MNYWDELTAQGEVIQLLEHALEEPEHLHHAWLFTGPPGSGRIVAAHRFAAALVAHSPGKNPQELRPAREHAYRQIREQTHPDVVVISSNAPQIDVASMRNAVAKAYYAPVQSYRRVIVVEDADRMNQHAANSVLKALEEPPATTVWILCAPTQSDLLPTISSRTRQIRLRTPRTEDVARLLVERDGVEPAKAEQAARLAQAHIGMAKTLAQDESALTRREELIRLTLGARSLSEAMQNAQTLHSFAEEDSENVLEKQQERDEEKIRHSYGVEEGEPLAGRLRVEIRAAEKASEETRKKLQTRSLRDSVDRVLLDQLALWRDIALLCFNVESDLIHHEQVEQLAAVSARYTCTQVLRCVEVLERARNRLAQGVTPLTVLEAVTAGQYLVYRNTPRPT